MQENSFNPLDLIKKCRSCKEVLISEHNIRPSALKKKDYICRECRNKKTRENYKNNKEINREKNRKRQDSWRKRNPDKALAADLKRFNIDVETYRKILKYQNNVCAICGEGPKKWSRLSVDHKGTKIRGLLCDTCNRALGLLGDTLTSFKKIYKLLETCAGLKVEDNTKD